ncbi:ester cyclase [Nucisporomicrobium flavum]|jgi:steroid delta-isomerase-like uncharacterized protein|uniref:ester cyclase n=1 Tax=Nucisporomicrobium flavum TaxID=2785915 RepID=UPI0018F558C0|nr:ester cyclase [Nucisporomicrobium flavum]
MPAERNKELVRRMTEAFNTGDLTVVDELLSADGPAGGSGPGTPKTSTDLKRKITALRKAFPDLRYTVDRMVAEGETVAFRWTMTGTHLGPLLRHPPTGRAIEHAGTDLVTFGDGRIVEHYAADNFGDLLGKLGIEPVGTRAG